MKEILTDFLDWMDEINNTNPMQLETDNDDIAMMYLDSGRAENLVRQGVPQPVQTADPMEKLFTFFKCMCGGDLDINGAESDKEKLTLHFDCLQCGTKWKTSFHFEEE